ncbi:hypothetical protein [Limnohabitans sp. DM1]|uniref:hypothetical protein n=1 Tax=Limnohabitans sp. DM1 TaxID=1597955 RepID=UPI001892BFD2|nr:hypothetical protein [Limnohabitans sp. DM1]
MKRITQLFITLGTFFLMTACGGGGSSDSYTANISVGSTSHVCKSEVAANLCKAGDCSQCQCLSGCPAAPGEAITLSCLFYDGIARVPSTGCTLATTPVRTLACSGTKLFILDGQGYTRTDVLQGTSFNGPQPYELFGFKFNCGA